jgi:serine/threonine protein kinase/predicted Zn-dependent protease
MTGGAESLFGGIEDIIESYEDACASGRSVSIRDFLPTKDDPSRLRVLQELIRVEMDRSFRNGIPLALEDYRAEYPELFVSPKLLAPLAFEEYRLRLMSAEPVDSGVFARKYNVDTSQWPKSAANSQKTAETELDSGVRIRLSPGELLLDFQIVGELGRGTFSRVYLARQTSLSGRLVVLKISSVRLREAERLARLQHTNIVPIYSVHEYQQHSVLCMPWFGSATLKDVIETLRSSTQPKDGGSLLSTVTACDSKTLLAMTSLPGKAKAERQDPAGSESGTLMSASRSPLAGLNLEQSALWIVRQLAEGLQHAHAKGILHRDLKPANVLLTEDGQPMILDFNLAAEAEDSLATDEIAGGTLPYMSPEQIASIDSFRSVNVASDVYSLGVILFELLTGRLPFSKNEGDRKAMIAERWAASIVPRRIVPRLSVDAESVIQKCLAPDPAHRYQTAQELSDDLDRHLHHLPFRYAANRSLGERLRKWGRRHPRIASVSGVVVLSIAALLGMGTLWWQGQHQLQIVSLRQQYGEFTRQVPQLHAVAYSAAIGDGSRDLAVQNLKSALTPFGVNSPGESEVAMARFSMAISGDEVLRLSREIQELTLFLKKLQSNEDASESVTQQSATQNSDDSGLSKSDSVDDYLKATQLVFDHRFAEAMGLLQVLSDRYPDRFPILFLRGIMERLQGDHEAAESLLTAAIALEPNIAQTWYQRGAGRFLRKKHSEAISDFSRVLEIDPNLDQARVARAMACQAAGRIPEALEDLNVAIQHEFSETRIWFLRSAVHQQLGNQEAAEKDLEEGLSRTPKDDRSWVARGLARLPNQPEMAQADFLEAMKLNPTSHDGYRNLSMVLSEYLKQPDESARVISEALTHHPEDAYLWAGRAVLHARAGRRAEAIQDAVEARKLSSDPLLIYMVACVYSLTSTQSESDRVDALKSLAESLREDATLLAVAASDPDLAAIRPLPQYSEVLQAARTLVRPVP